MITRVYLRSVVFLLLLTAGSKVVMAFSDTGVLDAASPLFSLLPIRQLLCLVAGLEIAVACLIMRERERQWLAALGIAFLATCFAGYRLALWVTGFQGYCQCLGSISDALHLEPDEANSMALIILGYFFVGSYALLLKSWRSRMNPGKVLETSAAQHKESEVTKGPFDLLS